ncbi:MAG: 50S ribosomal protein L3 [Bordetella sp.]|nr:MAG: 50S ribosomal protein L3 [Bordetella sp.]
MESVMSDSVLNVTSKRPGLIGRKVGMTRIFTDDGTSIPVTVIDVSNNRVAQVKYVDVDGYSAIQIAFGSCRSSCITRPQMGHFSKSGIQATKFLKEFRIDPIFQKDFHPGNAITVASVFKEGQYVDVTGKTIGKGFAGTIKRHNFRSQRSSHGNSRSHRVPGSIGGSQDPGRVFKGKKMAGHLGSVTRTIQNLNIVRIDSIRHLIFIMGAIPGHKNSTIFLRLSVKKIQSNIGIK